MRRFVLKVNASDCPGSRGRPLSRSDWEEGIVVSERPRQRRDGRLVSFDERRDPEPGDQLLIWVNEGDGGGNGLTATARVADCRYHDGRVRIQIEHVSVFPNPRLDTADLARRKSASAIFDELHRSTVRTLRIVDSAAWNEFVAASLEKRGEHLAEAAQPAATVALPPAAGPRPETPEAPGERERVWRMIEERSNRGPLRDALLSRHGARCAVTGCPVADVLGAAHLGALPANDPARDHPDNGILLRADIHVLFDLGLMAIDPDTRMLWVAKSLDGTEYGAMRGKPISTAAATANLRHHYAFARSVGGA